jgi:hypothetical protein
VVVRVGAYRQSGRLCCPCPGSAGFSGHVYLRGRHPYRLVHGNKPRHVPYREHPRRECLGCSGRRLCWSLWATSLISFSTPYCPAR